VQNLGLLLLISSASACRTALTSGVHFENLLNEFTVATTACGIDTAIRSFQQDCPRHGAAGAVLPFELNTSEGKVTLLNISASSRSNLLPVKSSQRQSGYSIFAQITLYRMQYKKKFTQLRTPYFGISEFGFDILFHKAEGKLEHTYCKV